MVRLRQSIRQEILHEQYFFITKILHKISCSVISKLAQLPKVVEKKIKKACVSEKSPQEILRCFVKIFV